MKSNFFSKKSDKSDIFFKTLNWQLMRLSTYISTSISMNSENTLVHSIFLFRIFKEKIFLITIITIFLEFVIFLFAENANNSLCSKLFLIPILYLQKIALQLFIQQKFQGHENKNAMLFIFKNQ